MPRHKVTVVGAGNVGATTAQRIIETGLADVCLIDIVPGLPQGKALDLQEAAPVVGYDVEICGTNDYADTAGAKVVVITSGLARQPGMSRDDLLSRTRPSSARSPSRSWPSRPTRSSSSSPIRSMPCATSRCRRPASRASGCSGMAGVLDSARFRSFIAQELHVSVRDVRAFVLGGHGDTMVPLPRYSTVGGVPITELLSAERIEQLIDRTRNGGAEVVALLKTGSAYYAPAASVVEMVESILFDRKRVLPCAYYLDGEFNTQGLFVGVPVVLGAGGGERDLRDRADRRGAGRVRRIGRVRPGARREARLTTPLSTLAGPCPSPS